MTAQELAAALLAGSAPATAGQWSLMVALAIATLASEDLACVGAGLLVASGRLSFFAASGATAAGILGGDLGLVALGWLVSTLGMRSLLVRLVGGERLARGEDWARRRGPAVAFVSRFVPGTRTATYLALGALGGASWRLVVAFVIAVGLWTPALVALAAAVGALLLPRLAVFQQWALPLALVLLLLVFALGRAQPPLVRRVVPWRTRRRLHGALRRFTRWEFWPPWVFYPPLAPALGWLAVKHRSLALWTAANPGFGGGGGFVGESKAAALAHVPPDALARFVLVPAAAPLAARVDAARAFAARHALTLPLVVKPDVGQRGERVVITRTWPAVAEALASIVGDAIVQEHVAGVELGAFWIGLPGNANGTLFSLTEKHLPAVVGDGERTVADLVLADERAVALAPLYLHRLGERAVAVPAAGELVPLAEIGNHCRGAEFRDGAVHATPALAAAVERLARAVPGFSFGRFDLKAPSWDDFERGLGIRVLELNGVASEATHVYDRRYGVWNAWRTLYRQWALAFEAGRRHRARGATPSTAREVLGLLAAEWRRRRGDRERHAKPVEAGGHPTGNGALILTPSAPQTGDPT